ncbi:hypothetical protein J4G43_027780 [Bradyrhizobium barranii subsp. barranii]|uniref:DUF551 domain-containing protein n=1 Tax=Bradyrhizobium barranii subsp. barranii TaxID=2823807 RepID=A0A939S4P5_9BRAD|nr:hypothetical protein [Bradyrhizobium barranii]UEM08576.1 hypothetical protein J4G43_027780 [Bradyrhizobium barranii subsp. barranii]
MPWQPIETEPKNSSQRLVSVDPSDPEAAHLVTLLPDGTHFNGDVVIESMMDVTPTHWHPVPVDPK